MRIPVCITDGNPDKNLVEKLKNEADGILSWMVEGLSGYLEEGLLPTPNMEIEKERYKRFADPLSIFFEEYLEITDQRDFVLSADMDDHFDHFKKMEERLSITKLNFSSFFSERAMRENKRIGPERFRIFGLQLKHFRDDDLPF